MSTIPVLTDTVFVTGDPVAIEFEAGARRFAKPAAKKAARAKRLRTFLVEARTTPSTVGRWLGRDVSEWELLAGYSTIKTARHVMATLLDDGADAGFFTRGTEYRVRRTDTKVAA